MSQSPKSSPSKVFPTNYNEEKRKFFFDVRYNPQFEYATEVEASYLSRHGALDTTYTEFCLDILRSVLKKHGSESAYLESIEGDILPQPEVEAQVHSYLAAENLTREIRIELSSQSLARTSIRRNDDGGVTLTLRTPFTYRRNILSAVLHHEVGTHGVRWLNELHQPWHAHRQKLGFSTNYLLTEEGLATLNYYATNPKLFLWRPAIMYIAVLEGAERSFVELFQVLRKYIDDKERCWEICVRVKRGIEDTSQPGINTKDQVYIRGIFQVLEWLQKHDFASDILYAGKIDVNDTEIAESLATAYHKPSFIENREAYAEAVRRSVRHNGLELSA